MAVNSWEAGPRRGILDQVFTELNMIRQIIRQPWHFSKLPSTEKRIWKQSKRLSWIASEEQTEDGQSS